MCACLAGLLAHLTTSKHTNLISGKTSLLFSYAYSVAVAGGRVLFLCQRAKFEQAPPLLPLGVSRGDAAFERVDIK